MVLNLSKESGKTITVSPSFEQIALIVWRKNGGVLLPLELTRNEAITLQNMITESLAKTKQCPN